MNEEEKIHWRQVFPWFNNESQGRTTAEAIAAAPSLQDTVPAHQSALKEPGQTVESPKVKIPDQSAVIKGIKAKFKEEIHDSMMNRADLD